MKRTIYALVLATAGLAASACESCRDRIESQHIDFLSLDLQSDYQPNDVREQRRLLAVLLHECGKLFDDKHPQLIGDHTVLELAIFSGDVALVDQALQHLLPDVMVHRARVTQAMQAAARYGTPEVIRHLVEIGMDPNVTDADGFTPLMLSIGGYQEHLENTKQLLDLGADVSLRGMEEADAMTFAIGENDVRAIQLLVETGIDPFANPRNLYLVDSVASEEVKRLFTSFKLRR